VLQVLQVLPQLNLMPHTTGASQTAGRAGVHGVREIDMVIPTDDELLLGHGVGLPDNPPWNTQRIEVCLRKAAEAVERLLDVERPWARSPLQLPTRWIVRSDPLIAHWQDNRTYEVLAWLGWLETELARLAWSRARRMSWKTLAHYSGMSVRTAQRQHRYALSIIVWRLHGRPIPGTWSRRFLVDRVVALSRGI
jgi:hypothetical protein